MQFHAILSNPAHPEYGVATIPFPLSMKEYDHSMEVLSALEIGNAVRQDCKVDEITDCYPVLKRLEGQAVNVDELDYLAKRLDSFCAGEDAQFQAMAEKLDLTDIRDFINLTFCCQQATVITDFSNLEQIGKDHYMNLNGGCASMEELNNLDGEETARLLIDSGAGVVTPYGVVYDNGMKLELLYRGGVFPPYLYDAYPLVLEASPLSEPEDTKNMTLLCLPMTEKQLEHALARGGIDSVEQMRFKPDLILLQELSILPTLEQESLSDLNEMCEAIMPLTHNDLPKLGAAIIFAKPQNATQVKHLAENLKSAIFLILPEEDTTKNFMAGLMIQNLSRELFSVADENGGKLKNRVVLFCDELGTMPPFEILPLFSAGRSRRLTLVPIIQSLAQLEKNYGKEGCEIIQDNCQDTIFGGFAPNSQTAEVLSKSLGSRTVLSGSVSRGKNDPSQSLQMMERPLLTPDELKSIPKGSFIVMKTGSHPMRTRLRLFLDWGITFEESYAVPERAQRRVVYASRQALERSILKQYGKEADEDSAGYAPSAKGGMTHTPAPDRRRGQRQVKV